MSLNRAASVEVCLRAALAAFHLADRRAAAYRLTDALHPDEPPLQDPHPLQRLTRRDNKRPAIFLRFRYITITKVQLRTKVLVVYSHPFHFRDKENIDGSVRVYPGRVALGGSEATETCTVVPVDGSTTVFDLVGEALKRFGLGPPIQPEDYRCSEMLLDRGGIRIFYYYNNSYI